MSAIKNPVGRPKNHRLSDESKAKISKGKLGSRQTEKTKKKISNGVLRLNDVGAPIDIIMKTDLTEGHYTTSRGYVNVNIPSLVVGHPSYHQRLHVALYEKKLKRKLLPGEEIHHLNKKDDNRMEALVLCKDRLEHKILDKAKAIKDNHGNTSEASLETI